jgi:hypothetical protein
MHDPVGVVEYRRDQHSIIRVGAGVANPHHVFAFPERLPANVAIHRDEG